MTDSSNPTIIVNKGPDFEQDAFKIYSKVLELQSRGYTLVALTQDDLQYMCNSPDLTGDRYALPDMHNKYWSPVNQGKSEV